MAVLPDAQMPRNDGVSLQPAPYRRAPCGLRRPSLPWRIPRAALPVNALASLLCTLPFPCVAGYYPKTILLEEGENAPLELLIARESSDGSVSYEWEPRYVVITSNNLLYFKDENRPFVGSKPKVDMYLGGGSRVEEKSLDSQSEFVSPQACGRRLCASMQSGMRAPVSLSGALAMHALMR